MSIGKKERVEVIAMGQDHTPHTETHHDFFCQIFHQHVTLLSPLLWNLELAYIYFIKLRPSHKLPCLSDLHLCFAPYMHRVTFQTYTGLLYSKT